MFISVFFRVDDINCTILIISKVQYGCQNIIWLPKLQETWISRSVIGMESNAISLTVGYPDHIKQESLLCNQNPIWQLKF